MRNPAWLLALAMFFGIVNAPALAQTTGVAVAIISIEQARDIAARYGMARIEEIELDDGLWEVEGRDIRGRDREMKIDARTGAVVKIERR